MGLQRKAVFCFLVSLSACEFSAYCKKMTFVTIKLRTCESEIFVRIELAATIRIQIESQIESWV